MANAEAVTEYVNVFPVGQEHNAQKVSIINSKHVFQLTPIICFPSTVCPEGYYGDHCMNPCECPNDNFMCHPARGCICRHGYTGRTCEDTLVKAIMSPDESNYGSVVAYVVVILTIFLAMLFGLWYYYKKRVNNLKNEVAHVQYIADQQALSSGKKDILSI